MNETLQLSYDSVTEITQHPLFWGVLLGILVFTLIIHVTIGILKKAKTPSGRIVLSSAGRPKRMIMTSGFWIGLAIWVLIPAILIVALIIFPWWLKF